MKWTYERAVRHGGLNYHLWSADEGDSQRIFALTRTLALPPQRGPLYRSLEEMAAKTGVPVVPLETMGQFKPPLAPLIAIGVYRRDDGWAQVDYGNRQGPMPGDVYQANGYEPALDQLPSEAKYSSFQEMAGKERSK